MKSVSVFRWFNAVILLFVGLSCLGLPSTRLAHAENEAGYAYVYCYVPNIETCSAKRNFLYFSGVFSMGARDNSRGPSNDCLRSAGIVPPGEECSEGACCAGDP